MPVRNQEQYFRAQAICPGIATGVICRIPSQLHEFSLPAATVQGSRKWRELVEKAKKQMRKQLRVQPFDAQEVSIFETHLQLLEDESFLGKIEEYIESGLSLQLALEKSLENLQKQFHSMKSAIFRERFLDLHDVVLRLAHVASSKKNEVIWPNQVCIYSKHALPSCVIRVPASKLKALLCSEISIASHLAMLARSRGLPCLSKVQLPDHLENAPVIVDGYEGWIIVNPTPATLKRYQSKREGPKSNGVRIQGTAQKASLICSRPYLWGNIDGWRDIHELPCDGIEGIGLVRTEYLAYEQGQLPTLRSQMEFYKRLLRSQKGKPVVVRLFDFGSDKPFLRHAVSPEINPALGCRGIRFLLKEPTILKDQLAALLQASVEGPLAIMVPMVCTPSQMQQVRFLMQDIGKRLGVAKLPALGMMVEVPAAALMLNQFAPTSDFYSLGTNDLLQYVHAVDRSNEALSDLYNPLSPAFLNLIDYVARHAKSQAKVLTVCGEMAADPACLAVLQRMGINNFSMSPIALKAMIEWLDSVQD